MTFLSKSVRNSRGIATVALSFCALRKRIVSIKAIFHTVKRELANYTKPLRLC